MRFKIKDLGFKNILVLGSLLTAFFLTTTPAFAHVTVKPGEVGVGQRLNFVVSVPTEEDMPTIQVRLLIPEGLQSVRPNVKPGWNIQLVKTGEGEEAKVSEIIWSGGSIPVEQRDEFMFSAQAPAEEGFINWKAYQTYQGGMLVSWDQDPKVVEDYAKNNPVSEGTHNENAPKPFSTTKVINDLKGSAPEHHESTAAGLKQDNLPLILSIIAIALAAGSLWKQMTKRS